MTAHELAHKLLSLEDLPVTSYWGDPPDPSEIDEITLINNRSHCAIDIEETPNNPDKRCYLLS